MATTATNVDLAKHHAWFHHNGADGFITLAKKRPDGSFVSYHYRPEELAMELTNWLGEDVYFSQNTFYRPQRRIENIRELRSLYVDVDCYLFNADPEWTVLDLESRLFRQSIPEPNLIIYSGRGLVLVWLLEPAPYKALPLWQAIQNYLCDQLKSKGSDSKATDAARVFRIAGSTNSKSGATVNVQYRHEYKHTLREIQNEYLPELTPTADPKKRGRKAKKFHLYNEYSLYHARMSDLIRLCELRKYDMRGHREVVLFLYRYWTCCFTSDPEEALRQVIELNDDFVEPLRMNEVVKATRSAETAYLSAEKQYRYSNAKLVEVLAITADEQKHLKSIVGKREKYDRNNERRTEERRKAGVPTREEYEEKRKANAQDKTEALMEAIEANPGASNRKLAELTGVSEGYVRKLKKKMQGAYS